MTDEQINAAIAEACGWQRKRQTKLTKTGHFKVVYQNPPDYCSDLNAMHDAEGLLLKEWKDGCVLWLEYTHKLMLACSAHLTEHATARQRAEAFLRVLDKWKEVQP